MRTDSLAAPAVDGFGDAGLVERHGGVCHNGGAVGDAREDGAASSVEIVDDLDAEAVLLERDGGGGQRFFVG